MLVSGREMNFKNTCKLFAKWPYFVHFLPGLKVAFQILYSQGLLIFIHKTPVVENHPTTREIRELLRPRSTMTVHFYMNSSLIYKL